MNHKENFLRTVRFEKPDYVPMAFHINHACWNNYDQEALKDMMESHPFLFPDYKRPAGKVVPEYLFNARAEKPYTDPWKCVWETAEDGITGSVHGHPLETWDDFDSYKAPVAEETDGTYPVDWQKLKEAAELAKKENTLFSCGLPHGHTFLRLQDIRGYENLLFDMYDETPNLVRLMEMVEEFNFAYISKLLELNPDMVSYPEDLGMQHGPMISPELFKRFIKPGYTRLMQPAREKGCIIHMHSDGDIRALVDDLIDGGVEVINLQDLVNGIDWIAEKFSGKVCMDLDVDRQSITRFGTPDEIDALILEEVRKIGTPQGGLLMKYGLYPGVPLENAKAVMDAMEKYAFFYR